MFQIQGFMVKDYKPHVLIYSDNKKHLIELNGYFDWTVINRACIRCGKPIKKGYICQECAGRDKYLLSAKFDGTHGKIAKEIDEKPHVVYQAKRKGMWKVGSTMKERFTTRMLESGAELAGIIAETETGTLARKLEKFIQDEFKMPSTFEFMIPRVSPSKLIDFKKYYIIPDGHFTKVFGRVEGNVIGWFGPEIFFDTGVKINIKEWVGCVID